MDLEGVRDVSNGKLVQALRIVNHQLALHHTDLKKDLYLSEQRFNEVNDLWLSSRQENRHLREMVRKLNDQLSIATKVLVSVKEQSEQMFMLINRPHAIVEEDEENRLPRSTQVYVRKRLESPPRVNDAIIPEEDEEEELGPQKNVQDVSTDMDVSQKSLPTKDTSGASGASGCGQLLPNSPLVQRLKRRSKNVSFDESFETIEMDRVFKLSRPSHERRQIYAGLIEGSDNTLREAARGSMLIDLSSTGSAIEQSIKSIGDGSCQEDEETLKGTVEKVDAMQMELNCSSSSENSQTQPSVIRYDPARDTEQYVLKKTVSESMLSTIHRTTAFGEDNEFSRCSFEDITEFCPEDTIANASCSTPVTKGGTTLAKAYCNRTRSLARNQKMKSDTSLNRKQIQQPLVVVHPLTEDNIRSLSEIVNHRTNRKPRRATEKQWSEIFPSSLMSDGTTTILDPCSSTENLSVMSNESGRPRRKAAPKTLREHSLREKMRRN